MLPSWKPLGPVILSLCVCAVATMGAAPAKSAEPHAGEPLVQLAQHLAGDLNDRAGIKPAPAGATTKAEALASSVAPGTTEVQRAAIESKPLGVTAGSSRADDFAANAVAGNDKTPTDPMGGAWVFNTAAALGVVLGLIFITRALLRRMSGSVAVSSHSGVVEVLARVSVAPKSHVLVMRAGSRVLLVGESAAGLRTLCDITDPEEIAGVLASVTAAKPRSISRGFADMVGQFNREYRDEEEPGADADVNELEADRARNQVTGLMAKLRTIGSGKGAT